VETACRVFTKFPLAIEAVSFEVRAVFTTAAAVTFVVDGITTSTLNATVTDDEKDAELIRRREPVTLVITT